MITGHICWWWWWWWWLDSFLMIIMYDVKKEIRPRRGLLFNAMFPVQWSNIFLFFSYFDIDCTIHVDVAVITEEKKINHSNRLICLIGRVWWPIWSMRSYRCNCQHAKTPLTFFLFKIFFFTFQKSSMKINSNLILNHGKLKPF